MLIGRLNGGFIMSETQYDRLESLIMSMKDDMATVKTDIEVIKASVKDYPDKVNMVNNHETELKLIRQNCNAIQELKKLNKMQPSAIKTGIVVGVIVSVVGALVTIAVNLML